MNVARCSIKMGYHSQDGYRRIEAALLAAAFNDDQIINSVIESKDSDIKAIGNALLEVAPRWARN